MIYSSTWSSFDSMLISLMEIKCWPIHFWLFLFFWLVNAMLLWIRSTWWGLTSVVCSSLLWTTCMLFYLFRDFLLEGRVNSLVKSCLTGMVIYLKPLKARLENFLLLVTVVFIGYKLMTFTSGLSALTNELKKPKVGWRLLGIL